MENNTSNMPMQKSKPSVKIQTLLTKLELHHHFVRPTTDEGWKQFHKTNEDGIKHAYESPEGFYKNDNTLFLAGTKDMEDVKDWAKIPFGNFKDSKIYRNADEVLKNDNNIDTVVGHSAGGSAALEFEKNYENRNIHSVTYSAPVFERLDPEKVMNIDKAPLRFTHSGDVVSMFDMNAQTSFKAPEYNLDLLKDATSMFNNPSIENARNIGNSITNTKNFDPLSLHTMGNSYSNPSKPMDFVKSAVEGVGIAKATGII
jgi:hypothetical protein